MCSAIALDGGESPTYSLASETAGPSGAIAYALPSCCALCFPVFFTQIQAVAPRLVAVSLDRVLLTIRIAQLLLRDRRDET
jgi:hypothetical protein